VYLKKSTKRKIWKYAERKKRLHDNEKRIFFIKNDKMFWVMTEKILNK